MCSIHFKQTSENEARDPGHISVLIMIRSPDPIYEQVDLMLPNPQQCTGDCFQAQSNLSAQSQI